MYTWTVWKHDMHKMTVTSFAITLYGQALCGLQSCKNKAHSVSWPEVVKGIPNQGVDFLLARAVFSVSLLCFWCMYCCVWLFLVVSTSAIDCLKRLISEMTYYVSSGTLNPTHSLTHSLWSMLPMPVCRSTSRDIQCWRICTACVLNLIVTHLLLCLLTAILGTSVLLYVTNITWPTTWRHVLGERR